MRQTDRQTDRQRDRLIETELKHFIFQGDSRGGGGGGQGKGGPDRSAWKGVTV